MVEALAQLEAGSLDCRAQVEEGVTYASKIEPGETRIAWNRPAAEVHDMIRGLSPHPGAWFEVERRGMQRASPRASFRNWWRSRAHRVSCSTII